MNAKTKIVIVMGIASLGALPLMARPPVVVVPVPAPPPVVVVPAPAPPTVTVTIGVPDFYAWDGYEYVGIVGDQYYYLGPGNVWLTCDPVRLGRFHHWEKAHADWRVHATRNMKYRRDAKGHEHPWPDQADHGHGKGHDH